MDSAEQTRAREAKLLAVGAVLESAGLSALYETIGVAQAERLYDAMVDRMPGLGAATILSWCQGMQTDPAPGSVRYGEGWCNGLQALGERIKREFGL